MKAQDYLDEYLLNVCNEEQMQLRTHGEGYSYWVENRNISSETWEPDILTLMDNGEATLTNMGIKLKIGPTEPEFIPFYPNWAKVRRRIEDRLRKDESTLYIIAVRLGIKLED